MAAQFSPDNVTKITLVRPVAGKEQLMVEAMQKYANEVQAQEPDVLSWHIIDIKEPAEDGGKEYAVLERYTNEAAAESHYATPYFAELKATMANLRQPIMTRRTAALGGFMMRQ